VEPALKTSSADYINEILLTYSNYITFFTLEVIYPEVRWLVLINNIITKNKSIQIQYLICIKPVSLHICLCNKNIIYLSAHFVFLKSLNIAVNFVISMSYIIIVHCSLPLNYNIVFVLN